MSRNPANTDVFKRSSGHREKVTTCYDQTRRRHNIWKMTSDLRRVLKTSDLRLEDIWFTSFWRRPIYDVLKTSDLQRLQDVWFTTSWRRPIYAVSETSNFRHLEGVWLMTSWRSLIYDVLKTSVKQHLCSNVVATSVQRRKKWLFLILYCQKYSENFKLVYRYGILSNQWSGLYMIETSVIKEITMLNNKLYRIRGQEKE